MSVYLDDESVLRTDHVRLWSAVVVRLHDKLERVPDANGS